MQLCFEEKRNDLCEFLPGHGCMERGIPVRKKTSSLGHRKKITYYDQRVFGTPENVYFLWTFLRLFAIAAVLKESHSRGPLVFWKLSKNTFLFLNIVEYKYGFF